MAVLRTHLVLGLHSWEVVDPATGETVVWDSRSGEKIRWSSRRALQRFLARRGWRCRPDGRLVQSGRAQPTV